MAEQIAGRRWERLIDEQATKTPAAAEPTPPVADKTPPTPQNGPTPPSADELILASAQGAKEASKAAEAEELTNLRKRIANQDEVIESLRLRILKLEQATSPTPAPPPAEAPKPPTDITPPVAIVAPPPAAPVAATPPAPQAENKG